MAPFAAAVRALAVVVVMLSACGSDAPAARPPSTETRIEGLVVESDTGSGRTALAVERGVLRRRRFGAFSLPLYEFVAEGMRISLPAAEGDPTTDAPAPSHEAEGAGLGLLQLLSALAAPGAVTRVVVEGIDVEIGAREDPEFRITAPSGRVEASDEPLALDGGVEVRSRKGERLSARSGRLAQGAHLIRVSGPYEFRAGGLEPLRDRDGTFALAPGGALVPAAR